MAEALVLFRGRLAVALGHESLVTRSKLDRRLLFNPTLHLNIPLSSNCHSFIEGSTSQQNISTLQDLKRLPPRLGRSHLSAIHLVPSTRNLHNHDVGPVEGDRGHTARLFPRWHAVYEQVYKT